MTTEAEKKQNRVTFARTRGSYDTGYADGRRAVVRSLGFQSEAELRAFVQGYREQEEQQAEFSEEEISKTIDEMIREGVFEVVSTKSDGGEELLRLKSDGEEETQN